MSLKIQDIANIIEEFAPIKLKEDFDNVGLMVGDAQKEVTSILIALDCTLDVIQEANDRGCNLIISHHPLLFKKPSSITTETLLGKKIINLIKNDISLYSSHTNLDATKDGINDIIMSLLDFKNYEVISPNKNSIDNFTGLGRIATLSTAITLDELCDRVKDSLDIISLKYIGDEKKLIKKVAVINGSGNDFLMKAKNLGAECIITGDSTYHYASDLAEDGICLIDAGHFHTEWPGMQIVGKWLQNRIKLMGHNIEIILSTKTVCPYKYK
ncbi:Nif3-like dinuclear metal center hexameric protein [Clostridium peptidivorans]|uniref:Nif3-like dinuclear metal center hexameric protein n=1 Tax=Clostridium peptidivorans TaxID=100174 RepID=UPI000BE45B91|nr:Nif3-like dinuclear metal center hexameric protein [Clostridium peptidivorans]